MSKVVRALMATVGALVLTAPAMAWYAPDTSWEYIEAQEAADHGPLFSDPYVLGPTSPGKWGNPAMGTSGGVVTYSYADANGYATSGEGAATTVVALESFMPFTLTQIKQQIRLAFDAWEAVADITFVEVADSDSAFNAVVSSGHIRIGGHTMDGAGGTLAHAYYPPVNGSTAAGDLHFDSGDSWVIGFPGPGFDIFQVAAHEIGHAIGLAHSGAAGSLMAPFYSEAFSGPQADDIAGAQFIYGPAVIPEPASLGLLGAGGLLMLRRRRA